jgi:large subunit ribosomal protein L16
MFLFSKKAVFNKSFSGRKLTKKKTLNTCLSLNKQGQISLVAKENGKITNFQIEAIRRFLRRFLKKKAQMFVQIFPNIPITKKPKDIRQGRGKGNVKYWTDLLQKGDVIIELEGFDIKFMTFVLRSVQVKLSIKTYVFDRCTRWIL